MGFVGSFPTARMAAYSTKKRGFSTSTFQAAHLAAYAIQRIHHISRDSNPRTWRHTFPPLARCSVSPSQPRMAAYLFLCPSHPRAWRYTVTFQDVDHWLTFKPRTSGGIRSAWRRGRRGTISSRALGGTRSKGTETDHIPSRALGGLHSATCVTRLVPLLTRTLGGIRSLGTQPGHRALSSRTLGGIPVHCTPATACLIFQAAHMAAYSEIRPALIIFDFQAAHMAAYSTGKKKTKELAFQAAHTAAYRNPFSLTQWFPKHNPARRPVGLRFFSWPVVACFATAFSAVKERRSSLAATVLPYCGDVSPTSEETQTASYGDIHPEWFSLIPAKIPCMARNSRAGHPTSRCRFSACLDGGRRGLALDATSSGIR